MSTLKSSAEDLTLNADGSGNDVIIQSDGSTKAIVTAEGDVGIGTSSPSVPLHVNTSGTSMARFVGGNDGNLYITNDSANVVTLQAAGGDALSFNTNGGNERMRIDSAGDVTISTGNLVIGTSGKGIDFSADSDAGGMTSELLDDYEEGTWTPVFSGADTAGTYSYSVQVGYYTKIGNMVTLYCALFNITTSSAGAGNIRIIGMPFTPSSLPHRGMVGTLELDNFSGFTSGSLSTTAEDGGYIGLRKSVSGESDAMLDCSDRDNDGSDLCASITYMAT